MRCSKLACVQIPTLFLILFQTFPIYKCATLAAAASSLKDVFTSNMDELSLRVPRDSKPYLSRYGGSSSSNSRSSINRAIKPEESLDAAGERPQPTPVEKRCTRCESGYTDLNRYNSPYESRYRYEDKRPRDRYDYDDRRYDRYDDRTPDRGYDRGGYDRYYERRPVQDYDRYDYRDRYERDRYERPDRAGYNNDRYNNDRYERYNDRGVGYDNRGYDYRERYERDGLRPWDETYRGTSGFDSNGRGYYFAGGRPEAGSANYWGGGAGVGGAAGGVGGGGGGYASGWNYGGRDDYRDRGSGGYYSRPVSQYDGYRGTSYLYGRPSSSTTSNPSDSSANESSVTQNPQQQSSSR